MLSNSSGDNSTDTLLHVAPNLAMKVSAIDQL